MLESRTGQMLGGATHYDFEWTTERVEELRRLWADGALTGGIAKHFGVDRNAISGKINRLRKQGLVFEERRIPIQTTAERAMKRKKVVNNYRAKRRAEQPTVRTRVNHGNRFDVVERVSPLDFPKRDDLYGPFLPLVALPDRDGCRHHPWDMNAPGAGFCGNAGYPWCERCRPMLYQPPRPRVDQAGRR